MANTFYYPRILGFALANVTFYLRKLGVRLGLGVGFRVWVRIKVRVMVMVTVREGWSIHSFILESQG